MYVLKKLSNTYLEAKNHLRFKIIKFKNEY